MRSENPNKFINVIIYFLIISLTCLILYNLSLIINKYYDPIEPPRNSIKVGPTSTE
jgi:hypothetical protein